LYFYEIYTVLTSNVPTSLAAFGWGKAQLRDSERVCVEQLGDINFPRVIRTKPPPRNELGVYCLRSAVTVLPSSSCHPL